MNGQLILVVMLATSISCPAAKSMDLRSLHSSPHEITTSFLSVDKDLGWDTACDSALVMEKIQVCYGNKEYDNQKLLQIINMIVRIVHSNLAQVENVFSSFIKRKGISSDQLTATQAHKPKQSEAQLSTGCSQVYISHHGRNRPSLYLQEPQ